MESIEKKPRLAVVPLMKKFVYPNEIAENLKEENNVIAFLAAVGNVTPKDLSSTLMKYVEDAVNEFNTKNNLVLIIIHDTGIMFVRRTFFLEIAKEIHQEEVNNFLVNIRRLAEQKGFEVKIINPEAGKYNIQTFFEAFIDNSYEACAEQGFKLMPEGLGKEVILAFFISLCRTGQEDEAKHIYNSMKYELSDQPWFNILLRLTLGLTDMQQVLPQAKSEVQKFQVHFYSAARLNNISQYSNALDLLSLCQNMTVDCLEKLFIPSEALFSMTNGKPNT